MNVNVRTCLLAGHSFISRLRMWWQDNRKVFVDRDGIPMIDPRTAVHFLGRGGCQVSQLWYLLENQVGIETLSRYSMIVFDIGSNDLDSNIAVDDVGESIVRLVEWVHSVAPSAKVIVLQSLPRYSTRHLPVDLFNSRVSQLNNFLDSRFSTVGNRTVFWLHNRASRLLHFCADDVHLNETAYRQYASSIRRAVLHAVNL